MKELNEISTAVANLPGSNCLSTPPAGYFSSLPETIMAKIADAENTQGINPFISSVTPPSENVPEWEQSTIWGEISKESPLETPGELYFQDFKDNVLSRIAKEQKALLHLETAMETPIIPLYKKIPQKIFMQWAAAAAIVILVGISSLIYFQTDSVPANSMNLSAELPKIDDQELNAFIGEQPHEVLTESGLANVNSDEFESENLFSDVNDEEMKVYLQQDRLSHIVNLN
ncbi:MAG: hypothetical protein ACO29O_05305 [Chitinophagaceae bacterium]